MTIAMPFRRAVTLAAPFVRNELWRRARAVPTMDLRFADNKSLTDAVTGKSLVTFNRASSGTYVGSDGLIKTALTDAPRFDHNPTTGESLGLLVEEARTNGIRNNTMVGAVAGTPGTLPTNWTQSLLASGLTREIVGTGSANGIDYIDVRISGTAADTNGYSVHFDAGTAIAASSGQAWTGSVYLAIINGNTNGTNNQFLRVIERTGAGSYVTESNVSWGSVGSVFSPASQIFVTRASMGATTGFVQAGIYFNSVNGAAIDITLRIGLPQLEQGAFSTSVIPTSTVAVTRSADVASITGTAFSGWYRQDEGTVLADARSYFPGTQNAIATIFNSANSGNNRYSLRMGNTLVTSGGVQQAAFNPTIPVANTDFRLGFAYRTNDISFVPSYGAVSSDTSATLPLAVNTLEIGKLENFSSLTLNGTMRRLTYWPARLANSTLQSITQ